MWQGAGTKGGLNTQGIPCPPTIVVPVEQPLSQMVALHIIGALPPSPTMSAKLEIVDKTPRQMATVNPKFNQKLFNILLSLNRTNDIYIHPKHDWAIDIQFDSLM
jgi:hypothetical protein